VPDSLIPDKVDLFAPPKPKKAPKLREFGDTLATRGLIYDNALKAANELEPLSDGKHTLKLTGVDWADPPRFTRKQRKEAVLTGGTLARRMKGTWELYDNAGSLIQKRQQVVGAVPYLSSMGTFTHRGNEYIVSSQQRLRPGVFTRIKENGEIEAHANIMPGKGVGHRYFLDPEKGVFKIQMAQSEMPLVPLLQAMGVTDHELRESWGNELYQANMLKNDSSAIRKLSDRVLKAADRAGDEGTTRQKLVDAFKRMELDPEVTARTLGTPYASMDKDAILATTRKLLAVSRREQDPDDRDHLAYQNFYSPEDLIAERLRKDHGRLRANLFRKVSQAGNLDKMPSGALTQQLEQVLLGSGLGQALEEINPSEVFDKQSRITRMGEGGISSLDAIPDEARMVQPSHMGYYDPVRTPESLRVGVDVHMARGARKGTDGRIYTQLRDKTGNLVWKSPQDIADAVVATNDVFKWDTKRVPAMRGGKIDYVGKDEIDYVLPNFEDAFSPLANLVPLKSTVKAGRVAMGSRYITQALGLVNAEAPLVQSGLPGSKGAKSFEDEYGTHMGAVRASKPGRVMAATQDAVTVKYDDGTTEDVELYNNHPFNRKSYITQSAALRPGDTFKPGQLLARSNYTDKDGAIALGLNMRVAYWPYLGYNFEDATVISESAAKRMSSEHMYHHEVELTDRHKHGKSSYVSLFPQKFDRKTLDTLDDKGIIKPGSTVEYGQPLILAAKARDRAMNKIHKKRQPGYADESVTWDHHDPGVVTDVVWGRKGPVVLVKSVMPMQVGDKMSGRYGDKGVVANIIPDAKMPVGSDGRPMEVLLNPTGIVTRTNPAQTLEAALGRLAEMDGKPIKVPDFEDTDDMTEWVHGQLRQRGVSMTQDLFWPERNMKIPSVASGNRYMMKLHHTAEGKAQGRGSGAYSADDTPAKGGESGCFVGDTLVACLGELGVDAIDIAYLVEQRLGLDVLTCDRNSRIPSAKPVTDWFKYAVPESELVTITLASGKTITCTRNHEFLLSDGTTTPAGDLWPGDDLMEPGP
jgi:DNA-directed RNA polymerase subunit beta